MSEIFYSEVYKQNIKSNNDYIFKTSILKNEIWEKNICDFISKLIEPNTDFLDIGSNIGLISLAINLLSNNVKNIHCFECSPDTFISLKYNTQNKPNIFLYNFGLSDKLQICIMNNNTYNNGCNHIYKICNNEINKEILYHYSNMDVYEKNNNLFIATLPLDSFMNSFTNKISVIKIDVEGFELFVLQGAFKLIEYHKPIIFIEIFDSNLNDIIEWFNILNYGLFEKINEIDYIFVPKERIIKI